jgi:putative transposase
VGRQAPGLSTSTVSRLKGSWQQQLKAWQRQNLSAKQYIYFWGRRYILQRAHGRKAVPSGHHRRHQRRRQRAGGPGSGLSGKRVVLETAAVGSQSRGLESGPELAVGDGTLGFWKASSQVYGEVRWQRCWVHKTVNVLDKLPKSLQAKAKANLQQIWITAGKNDAKRHLDDFIYVYGTKYPKAAECLQKNREPLLAFYDFPAEH